MNFTSEKNFKCLLITPPLLEPTSFYTAMPILAGQLIANGFDAKNLDLNIKFFRTILTKEYIKKTEEFLKTNNVKYDKDRINYLAENVKDAIKNFREIYDYNEYKREAIQIVNEILTFISTPYPFKIQELKCFENVYKSLTNNWDDIKEVTFSEEKNIFISFFEDVINDLREQKIDFIGISVPFPATIIPALTLARLLKERTNIHVSIGGNFLKSENVKNHPEILDLYCHSVLIGDGEKSIVELVRAISEKKEINNISGLIYKNEENIIVNNPPKPITSMDDIANASFDGINFSEYMTESPYISIMISKGCYWGKCTFCSLGPKYGRYCIKKPEKVVSDIKELIEKYKLSGWFCFQDDAIHPNYLNKLADEIFKQHLHFCYSIFGRFEKEFTRELLEKLYKSGLRNVYWGLESGSKKTLQDMQKGIDIEIAQRILKDASEIGMSNMAGVIVNFPTETMKEYNETIEFLETVKNYVIISPGNFAVMRNSIIGQNCDKYGIKILEDFEFSYGPTWEHSQLSKEEKDFKWQHFCDCVKKSQFKIDYNKNL